jgi:hypothetical protein
MAEAIFPLFIFTAGNYFTVRKTIPFYLIYINEFIARLLKTA